MDEQRHIGQPEGPTERQQEYIAWTWFGLTNQEIAARYGAREQTVKNQMRAAQRRLGISRERGDGATARARAAVWLWQQCVRHLALAPAMAAPAATHRQRGAAE